MKTIDQGPLCYFEERTLSFLRIKRINFINDIIVKHKRYYTIMFGMKGNGF